MNGSQRLRKRGDIPSSHSDPFTPTFPDPVQDLSPSADDAPAQYRSQPAFPTQPIGTFTTQPNFSAQANFSTQPAFLAQPLPVSQSAATTLPSNFSTPQYHFQPAQNPGSESSFGHVQQPSYYSPHSSTPDSFSPSQSQENELPMSSSSNSYEDTAGAFHRSRRRSLQSMAGPPANGMMGPSSGGMMGPSSGGMMGSSSGGMMGSMGSLSGGMMGSSKGSADDNKYARKSYLPRWLRQLSPATVMIVIGALVGIILLGVTISWVFGGRSSSSQGGPAAVDFPPAFDRAPAPSQDRFVPQPTAPAPEEQSAAIKEGRDAAAAAKKQAFLEKQKQREAEKERERQQAVLAKQREQEALAAARRAAEERVVEPDNSLPRSHAELLANQRRLAAESRRQAYQHNQGQTSEQLLPISEQAPPPVNHHDQERPTVLNAESPPSGRWQIKDGFYVSHGGELGAPMASLDECRAACEQTEECRAITMYKKMGHCSMKSHAVIATHSDWYSELKETQESPWVVVPDTYISGGDDATSTAYYTLAECRTACLQFPSCIAITQNENSNECFLKTKAEIFPHQSWHTEVLKRHAHLIKK